MTQVRKRTTSAVFKLCLIAVLCGLVIVPLVNMLTVLRWQDITTVFGGTKLWSALGNTVLLTLTATAIVLLIAYGLAFSMQRTGMRFKSVFSLILILPMLIPSISHGMGLIILFGNNGLITRLLGLKIGIYGPLGIILGSVMYAFPVAFIMLNDVLRYEDISVYQAADVLGISKKQQFLRITLPYIRRPLIATAFSTFSLIATDYGVPLMIGGTTKTVARLMYDEVIGQLQFGRGCVYGIILLIPAILAFITDVLNKDRAGMAFVKRDDIEQGTRLKNTVAYVICTLVAVVALLPIVAFLLLAFAENYPTDMTLTLDNVINTMDRRGGGGFLLNSLIIAVLTATVGTVFGFVTAYFTARTDGRTSKVLHLLSLTLMAVPGIVLGLSYVVTFAKTPLVETLIILVMVNTAHFISSPYLMMYNSFGKMNENLEAVGETLGIGRVRMIKDVFLPISVGTILEMFSYLFVNSMMTISAVSFLDSLSTRPISLMINQFEMQMQYESAAVVSLIILLVNVLLKTLIGIFKKKAVKKTCKTV